MSTTNKRIAAIVAAVLTASAALPAAAAPAAKPAQATQIKAAGEATDFSARRYRRGNNAAAAAMFGAVAGTIATIAINEQRRKRERDYWRYRHSAYGHGAYGYAPGYYAPQAYYGGYHPRYGNPYAYGTPYHGPRGPWAPPCARGFC